MTEIYRAEKGPPPRDIDGLSAPPAGYKHYLDASGNDPIQKAKIAIMANFPAVSNIQAFHEEKSDMGGAMKIRFMFRDEPIQISLTNDQILKTLSDNRYKDLGVTVQNMTPTERGIYNSIISAIKHLKKVRTNMRVSLGELDQDVRQENQSA